MAVALQKPSDVAEESATLQFVFQQLLLGVATAQLCKVISCSNDGGLVAQGRVVVQVLVNQIAGDGSAIPHGQIVDVPYLRVQGGTNAVIVDPVAGDVGCVVFASRDISAVKETKAASNPGSYRSFSMADAMYLGGMLNGVPEQYVRFSSEGMELVSPTRVRIQAPAIELDGPVTATETITAQGTIRSETEVQAGNIGVTTHKHPTAPTGPVSPPIP